MSKSSKKQEKHPVNEIDLYGTSLSTESIKVIAESIGIASLPDDAAKELADVISFKLKHIIQDAAKFMHRAKRMKLLHNDIDSALKVKNLEVSNFCIYIDVQNLMLNYFSHNMDLLQQNHYLFVLHQVVDENYISLKKKKLTSLM